MKYPIQVRGKSEEKVTIQLGRRRAIKQPKKEALMSVGEGRQTWE